MQRLFHAVRVQGRGQETVPADGLAASLDDYDRVLYELIYETYRAVGGELEVAYRQAAAGSRPTHLADLARRLDELDEIAYAFSLLMMAQLRNGTVGRRAPDPLEPAAGPPPGGSV
jgi:hypothetical protein